MDILDFIQTLRTLINYYLKRDIMKNIIIGICLIVAGYIAGYYFSPTKLVVERCAVDHSKDYQAACVLSDVCRMALDSPDLTWGGFEDLYWDYILNLDTDPSLSITWEQVHRDYSHIY